MFRVDLSKIKVLNDSTVLTADTSDALQDKVLSHLKTANPAKFGSLSADEKAQLKKRIGEHVQSR